ncbi:MAG: hypothetical protein ACTS8U_01730 [Arsenophonus sp. ET-DL9-MAG3]
MRFLSTMARKRSNSAVTKILTEESNKIAAILLLNRLFKVLAVCNLSS